MKNIRSSLVSILMSALVLAVFATPAAAQAPGQPGQPQVTVNGDAVIVSWTPPTTGGPVIAYLIHATYNGVALPGSPFNIGSLTTVGAGPLPIGTYTIAVTAANASGTGTSAPTTFVIGSGTAPGAPTLAVPVVSGNTVGLQWSAVANATGYELSATIQATGQTFVIPVGNQTTFIATQVPAGSFTLAVRATNPFGASAFSAPQIATVSGPSVPGTPTLFAPSVSGNTVTLSWAAPSSGGAPTGYEIEALVQDTGQTLTFPVPAGQTSISVPNVPAGNFIVRIRARNALGAGPFSGQQIVVVGTTLITGDMVVTLTWNTGTDIDLHVIEPNGTHVYFANPDGTSAFLDVDDINGFGPEHIYVQSGAALPGTYQFYIVHFSGETPTTSTIAVTLYPGTLNERTAFFTRSSSSGDPGLGFNVANVDIGAGTIVETTGTRVSGFDEPSAADAKGGKQP